jgi:hypothetical protein
MNKLLSGRYFLTLCAGVAFVYLACVGKLDQQTSALIIVMVMKDYFSKGQTDGR